MESRHFRRILLTTLFFFVILISSFAQQQKIDVGGWVGSVYLPADYNQTSNTYPAIIFLPGVGEIGNNYSLLISNGPSAYIAQGWDGKALGMQFIVISIQPPAQWPRPWDIKAKIDILKSKYRIGKYFVTGLSMGGWASLWYSYYYPNEIPGIVGVESVVPSENSDGGTNYEKYIHETYAIPAKAGQRYLLFEQKNNWMRNDQVIDGMNLAVPGSGIYVYTAFNGGGHCCWNEFYGGGGKQPGRFAEINNMNLYEWMASVLQGGDKSNISPIANAGTEKTITLPTNIVSLAGSGSDPDGKVVSYLWTKISGPSAFNIVNPKSAVTDVSGLTEGVYQFQLTVTDDKGATGSATIKVTVNSATNKAPVANAGSDKTTTLPINAVTLTGSGTDADGTITAYQWSKLSGPDHLFFVNPKAATTEVNGLVEGVYQFQLTVTDDKGATGVATTKVTVLASTNKAPVANAGTDKTITLPVNTVSLSGSGTDADGKIVSYAWTKVSGPNNFNIVNSKSAVTDVSGLVAGVYQFELTVTDDKGATGVARVNVTVKSSTNIAPAVSAGTDVTITLPTNSVSLTGWAKDDDGWIASFEWSEVSGRSDYKISSPNTINTQVTGLNAGVYTFKLKVVDNDGTGASNTLKVTVLEGNKAPVANAGTDKVITLPTSSVSLIGSGSDADGKIVSYSWTKVSGPGTYTIENPKSSTTSISGLGEGTYQFQLTVTDDKGATGKATVKVTVNPAKVTVPVADAGSDKTVILPTNSVALTGSGTDEGGGPVSYTWTKVSGPDNYSIANPQSPTTQVSNLVEGVYQFQLAVTNSQGATGTALAKVTVSSSANKAPSVGVGKDIYINLPANSVQLSGSARDEDGEIASYEWSKVSGPANYKFSDPGSTATMVTGLVAGVYTFKLLVTDDKGAKASSSLNVIVLQGNKSPVANAGTDKSITLPVNSVTLSGSGTDEDGRVVAFSWEQKSGPSNYKITNPSSAITDVTGLVEGIYQFQLTVTDDKGTTGAALVKVTVKTSTNIAPAVSAGNNVIITLPVNSVSLSGWAKDDDGWIASYEWSEVSGRTDFSLSNPSSINTLVTGLKAGDYTFKLKVVDNAGQGASSTVKVTVNAENTRMASIATVETPVISAGGDIQVILPEDKVELNGKGRDFSGAPVRYQWTQISGPSGARILSENSPRTQIERLRAGNYSFALRATDMRGLTVSDTMRLLVRLPDFGLQSSGIRIYPNPVSKVAKVEISGSSVQENLLLTITDVTGKVLKESEFVTAKRSSSIKQLDLTQLPGGFYIITLRSKDGKIITSRSFIKR